MTKRRLVTVLACIVGLQFGVTVVATIGYSFIEGKRYYNNMCAVRWLIDEKVLDTAILDTKPSRVALPGSTLGTLSGQHPLDQAEVILTRLLEDDSAILAVAIANVWGLACSGAMLMSAMCLRADGPSVGLRRAGDGGRRDAEPLPPHDPLQIN